MLKAFWPLCVLFVLAPTVLPAQDTTGSARWEPQIAAFDKQDAEHPPAKGGVVFVGSSSIRLWKLDESFPKAGYLNRGFGGSEIADSTHFIERLVLKHEPRVVVLYAGDNDIAKGKSAQRVADDFVAFQQKLHERLPECRLLFIAVKPSLKRWSLYPTMDQANQKIRDRCESDPRLQYVDIAQPMLGDDGFPRPELFAKDGLHLNDAGYKVWTQVLEPLLAEALKAD